MNILKKVLTATTTIAFAIALAPSARANTITVSNQSIVGSVFTYQISEDIFGRISGVGAAPSGTTDINAAGTTIDDYFTIYDFYGYVAGSAVSPSGWTFMSNLVGPTDSSVSPVDSPTITNLTWYKTGGSTGPGPFTVTGFSATSTSLSTTTGYWTSEDTNNSPGFPADGSTNAAVGHNITVAATPEPAFTGLLLSGLLGVGLFLARRYRVVQS